MMSNIGQPKVNATIKYLKCLDLYENEKPFKINLDVSDMLDAKKTNHVFVDQDITVTDVRGIESNFSLDRNGFHFGKCPTTLSAEELGDDEVVKSQLYPKVEAYVKTLLPQGAEVFILHHLRRQRSKSFPNPETESLPPHPNPVLYAHGDFTPAGAQVLLKLFWEKKRPDLYNRRYQMINLWRVVKGPNQDWPLACCDYQSLDVCQDVEISDDIHRYGVGEHSVLFPSDKHQWYYMDNQDVDDVIVIRHCDSLGLHKVPFSPHVSFDRAAALGGPVPPRESIEFKMVCFLDEKLERI